MQIGEAAGLLDTITSSSGVSCLNTDLLSGLSSALSGLSSGNLSALKTPSPALYDALQLLQPILNIVSG